MTKHEAPSEPVTHSDYDRTSEEKLRYARSATGWGILVFAAVAIVPSVYDGLHNGAWVSRATILCSVCLVVNLFVYRRYTVRLGNIALLANASNQSSEPTPASGTSRAGHDPRLS